MHDYTLIKMKIKLHILLLCSLLISCVGASSSKAVITTKSPSVEVKNYNYRVERVYPHSQTSYTQGLIYTPEGYLLEGTGLNGESRILRVDLESGSTKELASLKDNEFGEGITILGDTLFQLTWTSNRAYFYDSKTFEKIGSTLYAGEGWGLTTDGEKLYMSDGSSRITVRNPKDFKVERGFNVTYNGQGVMYLNELEWIDGKIWANVYTTEQIVIINPESGVVEGVVDLTGLLSENDITQSTDVLNGIAYDKAGDRIFVTGKNWNKLFEIKISE